ncbi:hypothetical protein FHR81_001133 [Actinoalloteichus hoggarensis]|uniref:Uncharacterized protein n=1 Tax=Actinoalloteichus hoggarensis TaxID=1470176 RepID=A0A221VZD1_9PSEU|nr:hypothetical protein [Actinoalloteichus hoggarensis]ASO18868.1 hypothetical protein AHOG_06080 [Actinoalloteichus hoggarensis]MBB5920103.1 hypothetical protein [Actinoalloteichus hoggarensis]
MTTAEVIRLVLLFAHLIGHAAIIGSYILQMHWKRGFDFRPLVVGSVVAVLTGCALIAVREMTGLEVDRLKMVVKLGVATAVFALSVVGLVRSRRLAREQADDAGLKPLLLAAGLLAMADIAVALGWQ